MKAVWHAASLLVLGSASLTAAGISGKVLEDHNNAPLALAGVRVVSEATHAVIAELDTDGQGKFQTPSLPAGPYRLEVSRPNFLDTVVRVQLTYSSRSITARLIRRVAFSGQVTDTQGAPMVGVFVFALPKPHTGAPPPPYANLLQGGTAPTDRQGKYRLFGLPPGDYLIALVYGASTIAVGQSGDVAVKSGVGSGALFYPTSSQPQVFTVAGGEDLRNINFTAGQSLLFSVSGRVELPSTPFSIWLALTATGQPTLATAVAQANPDGTFKFEGVPPGRYNLFASGPSQGRNGMGTFLGPKPRFGRSAVTISGQNIEGLEVALAVPRTATVSAEGTCGASVSSVKVRLLATEDWAAVLGQTLDLSIGQEIKALNLAPAKYRLELQDAPPGCTQTGEATLDLTGPDSSAKVMVATTGSIRGHAPPGAETGIAMIDAEGKGGLRIAVPDEKGIFEFADVPPGRYRLSLRNGSGPAYSSLTAGPGKAREVEVRGGAPTEVDLQVESK
jgi:hypothetical protein